MTHTDGISSPRAMLVGLFDLYVTSVLDETPIDVAAVLEQCPAEHREELTALIARFDATADGSGWAGEPAETPEQVEAAVDRLRGMMSAQRARRRRQAALREALRGLEELPRRLDVVVETLHRFLAPQAGGREPLLALRTPAPAVQVGLCAAGVRHAGAMSFLISHFLGATSDAGQARERRAAVEPDSVLEDRMDAEAERVLLAAGAAELPTPLEALAEDLGLVVISTPLDGPDNVDGALIAGDDGGVILIASGMPDAHRQRYTLAHEIAHFLLHRDTGTFRDTPSTLHDYDDEREREANTLAAHLVMPAFLFPEGLIGKAPTQGAAMVLMERFNVSHLALLRRMVRASRKPCALVVAQHGAYHRGDVSPGLPEPLEWAAHVPDASGAAGAAQASAGTLCGSVLPASAWGRWAAPEHAARQVREDTCVLAEGWTYSILTWND